MYSVQLKDRKEVASGTMAFYFEKPKGLDFKAGQFMELTLIDPPQTDAEGNTRAFTIASALYEADLMIATRMRDTAFKRVLKTLPLGSEVSVDGPFGVLTLHVDAARPAAFLAGGIGITPFRSMVLAATKQNLAHRLFLLYSNRRPEDAAFLDELEALGKQNPRYTLVATMTEMAKSARFWQGSTGYITREMLEKSVGQLTAPVYYIAGPPGLVKGMQKMLSEARVDRASIRAEEFAGY